MDCNPKIPVTVDNDGAGWTLVASPSATPAACNVERETNRDREHKGGAMLRGSLGLMRSFLGVIRL